MATYTVTKVRQGALSGPHASAIEGVCTSAGDHYMRWQVVDSIDVGDT